MNSTDLRSIKTERALQGSLIHLMQSTCFSDIQTKDIYSTVLIGKSTFYNHYLDKFDLLNQLVTNEIQSFEKLLNHRFENINETSILIELYEELFRKKEEFLTLCSSKNDGINFQQLLIEHISAFVKTKIYKKSLPVPNEFVTSLYASSALQAIIWSLKLEEPIEISKFMNKVLLSSFKNYL
ncbi:TetR/AcrR family transcriptional regulator [Fructobacillus sp. M158]|uniref:TetR/AcrR family transcriptional regulator n=1 Tax=Fructobacillus parabroussonetiae TaxID=2713174 RepID=UPI00200B8377|nr:TetR/AcrR family transcriptional regulator [Fructobacillus parabroussonetiae]MCK8617061.1 TetR/AcrR family transcriptional regulator [Fructobacillus parabroussonetiae]